MRVPASQSATPLVAGPLARELQFRESRRVAAYKAGADDIVAKPMNLTEMHLRLHALMRRVPHAETQQDRVSVGCLTLDRTACMVYVKNRSIQLTPSEFNLLNHMMSSPGRIFSSEDLLRDVWNYYPGTGDPTIVRMQVMKLRHKNRAGPQQSQLFADRLPPRLSPDRKHGSAEVSSREIDFLARKESRSASTLTGFFSFNREFEQFLFRPSYAPFTTNILSTNKDASVGQKL